jgi:hypothetical protein
MITRDESSSAIVSSAEGKRTERFSEKSSRYIEILSNLRFGSLEIRDTSVTRATNKSQEKDHGQDAGKHIEGGNQYQIADLS